MWNCWLKGICNFDKYGQNALQTGFTDCSAHSLCMREFISLNPSQCSIIVLSEFCHSSRLKKKNATLTCFKVAFLEHLFMYLRAIFLFLWSVCSPSLLIRLLDCCWFFFFPYWLVGILYILEKLAFSSICKHFLSIVWFWLWLLWFLPCKIFFKKFYVVKFINFFLMASRFCLYLEKLISLKRIKFFMVSSTFIILFHTLKSFINFKFVLVRDMNPHLFFSGVYSAFSSQIIIKFLFSMPFWNVPCVFTI